MVSGGTPTATLSWLATKITVTQRDFTDAACARPSARRRCRTRVGRGDANRAQATPVQRHQRCQRTRPARYRPAIAIPAVRGSPTCRSGSPGQQEQHRMKRRRRGPPARKRGGARRGRRARVPVPHGGRLRHHAGQWVMSPWARSSRGITGGVVKVWCGAGEGTVHSARARLPRRGRAPSPFFSDQNSSTRRTS